MSIVPFHLAFPVSSLERAREFYGNVLQCTEGRSDPHWVDFDFFGHQIVAHLATGSKEDRSSSHSPVDGDDVPVPHFGVVLEWEAFHELAARLESLGQQFVIPPRIRFRDQPGEQATMFLFDPCGNALEFKAFRDPSNMFRK